MQGIIRSNADAESCASLVMASTKKSPNKVGLLQTATQGHLP
jgi:hypothetical protein